MAKMTKTQILRMLVSIEMKAGKLAFGGPGTPNPQVLSVQDYIAIQKITKKAFNKLK